MRLPTAARSGVTVRPMAVTTVQKSALARSTSPAEAAAPMTIRLVSDGLAIMTPTSTAVP